MNLSDKTAQRHLAIIILSFLFIRGPLVNLALWHDEIYNTNLFLNAYQTNGPEIDKDISDTFTWGAEWKKQLALHPPLLSVFYYCWNLFFGDSELSLHIPPFMAGLGGVIVLYFIGSMIFGRDVGFIAAAAMSFSPSSVEYSVQAIHAVFEAAVFLMSIFLLCKFLKTEKKYFLYFLLSVNLCGVFLFYHYFFYLIVQTAFLGFYRTAVKIHRCYFILVSFLCFIFIWHAANSYTKGFYELGFWPKNSPLRTIKNIIYLPRNELHYLPLSNN